MARKRKRQEPRRLFGPIFFTLACLFVWASVLTYHVADWPNPSQVPHNEPARNACGRAGSLTAYQLFYWIGDGVYPLVLFGTLAAGLWLLRGRVEQLLQRTFGLVLLIACTSTTVHLLAGGAGGGGPESLVMGDGGVLGAGLGSFLLDTMAGVGTTLVLIYSFLVALLFVAEGWVLRFPSAVLRLRDASGEAISMARETVSGVLPRVAIVGDGLLEAEPTSRSDHPELKINPGRSRPQPPDAKQGRLFEEEEDEAQGKRKASKKNKRASKKGETEEAESENASHPEPKINIPKPVKPEVPKKAYPTLIDDWSFPPLDMLHDPETGFTAKQESLVRAKARLLEQTLEEFRLDARVVEIDTGPVITMFELQLGAGIKVSQIASLSNDVARALKAPAVRVVAPIPGKNTVGIEVPNIDKEKVRLKELITLSAAKAQKMALPIFFGKDASGAVLIADLASMPHMLIAGTTGSGKSVCINSIVASMLMTKKPDEVKLILVDPKMVEMSQFKGIPHLMSPIITDMNRAEQILDWAVTKMDERYELLAEARVRNIASFNRLGEEEIYKRFVPSNEQEKAQIPKRLPYIVIIIDELADLMMTAAKEVEHHLARLAQKSRAVGVHIVVATQRPEAKVVTGLIKSNLPCRCAFRVASRMDSRIVLDQNGAEVLMGQGDMLFLPPGSHKLIRAQGTLLEDDELQAIIEFLTDQAAPEFHPQLMRIKHKGIDGSTDRDPLFDQAVRIVLDTKRGSVSLLQRRLSVGYSRASRLIDEMAEAGVVGEFKGSQAREVAMTLEEWDALKAQVDKEVAEDGYAADGEDFGTTPDDDPPNDDDGADTDEDEEGDEEGDEEYVDEDGEYDEDENEEEEDDDSEEDGEGEEEEGSEEEDEEEED